MIYKFSTFIVKSLTISVFKTNLQKQCQQICAQNSKFQDFQEQRADNKFDLDFG